MGSVLGYAWGGPEWHPTPVYLHAVISRAAADLRLQSQAAEIVGDVGAHSPDTMVRHVPILAIMLLLMSVCDSYRLAPCARLRPRVRPVTMMEPAEQLAAHMKAAEVTPESVTFKKTIELIELNYDAKAVAFSVGEVVSEAGQNMGSAKILSLGKVAGLSEETTLQLFGEIYADVVATPDSDNHPNIRNFMKVGWEGVTFPDGPCLVKK